MTREQPPFRFTYITNSSNFISLAYDREDVRVGKGYVHVRYCVKKVVAHVVVITLVVQMYIACSPKKRGRRPTAEDYVWSMQRFDICVRRCGGGDYSNRCSRIRKVKGMRETEGSKCGYHLGVKHGGSCFFFS